MNLIFSIICSHAGTAISAWTCRFMPENTKFIQRLQLTAATANRLRVRITASFLYSHPSVEKLMTRLIRTDDQPRIGIPRIFIRMMDDSPFRKRMTEGFLGTQSMQKHRFVLSLDPAIT